MIYKSHRCPKCNKEYTKCNGHYYALFLPIVMLNPAISKIFAKKLAELCLDISRKSGRIRGCGQNKCKCEIRRSAKWKIIESAKIERLAISITEREHFLVDLVELRAYLADKSNLYRAIITKLPIVPPGHIPPEFHSTGTNTQNSIYIKYMTILTDISLLRQQNSEIVCVSKCTADTTLLSRFCLNISDLMMPKKTGDGIKMCRLEDFNTKSGIIRGYMVAYRASSSARAVATSARGISPGITILPRNFTNIVIIETVTKYNVAFINDYASRGLVKWRKSDKSDKFMKYFTGEIYVGDIIGRRMIDGDVIKESRYPVLHKGSIQTFYCKFARTDDSDTIKYSSPSTVAFAGDFDGDESNIFILSTTQAIIQMLTVGSYHRQILGSNGAEISMFFHECSAFWMFSENWDKELSRPFLTELIKTLNRISTFSRNLISLMKKTGTERITHRMIFSTILPPDLYYANDGFVIEKGLVVGGRVGSTIIGKSNRGLVATIARIYDTKAAYHFIDMATQMSQIILAYMPLSVGWNDISAVDMTASIKSTITNADRIYTKMAQYNSVKERDMLALGIDKLYTELTKEATSRLKNINNGLTIMINSGGRGNPSDHRHMAALIGQQYYRDGEKVDVRNLPIASTAPLSVQYGFISTSYSAGMNPIDTWISACSARQCIAHSKLNVQEGGNLMRLLASSLSNMRAYHAVCHNGSVYITQLTLEPSGIVSTKTGSSIIDIDLELKRLRAK